MAFENLQQQLLVYRLFISEQFNLTNLRHTLYLISPNETAVPSIEQVPNYNDQVCLWWMTLLLIEFTLLWLFGHSDRFALNDTLSCVFAGMLSQCFKFGGRAVAIFGYVWVWDNLRLLELHWDSSLTWILCFFTQDLAYYVGHRAIHEMGFFWGLHTIHHSSEYFNFSIGFRQAAIQDIGLAAYDILQAFFIPPSIFLVHRYFSEIFQFWMHTSLLGTVGPLGWVFNTPSHHRVHHGRNAYCVDRNFGGVLIIWDKMFGTFEAERLDDPPAYGLINKERSFNQLWLQFHTLKELLCDKWHAKDEWGVPLFPTLMDKLKALFFPPAWYPGVKTRLFFHWAVMEDHTHGVPPIEKPIQKYNPPLSTGLKAYCLGHVALLLAIFLQFEYDRGGLSYLDFCLKLVFLVCTMQSIGAFLDKRRLAPFLEICRSIGTITYCSVGQGDAVFAPENVFLIAIFGCSATIWTVILLKKAVIKQCRRNGAKMARGIVYALKSHCADSKRKPKDMRLLLMCATGM